jgi:uncharacterized protein YPO0396
MSEQEYTIQRLDKIDSWMQKLTEISVDLKSMLAVHEQRLGQHDKNQDYIEDMVEKRRIQTDKQIDDVYNTMREQDNGILKQLNKMREESTTQHAILAEKISKMEKMSWMYLGAFSVISFLIAYGDHIIKLIMTK